MNYKNGTKKGCYIFIKHGRTKNIIYFKETLRKDPDYIHLKLLFMIIYDHIYME